MSIDAQEAAPRLAASQPSFSNSEATNTTRLSVETDVSLDGAPGPRWLVVTDAYLGLAKDKAGDEIIRSIPCPNVDAVRTIVGVGSGRLQVQVGEEWQDLLRFSNSLADRFEKLARRLDTWFDNGREGPIVEDIAKLDAPTCPTCQLRLQPRQDSCPRCLPRKQLLQRAASFLTPYWRGSLGLCLLTVIGVTAELIPPKLQQYMVDHLLTNSVGTQSAASIQTSLLVVVLALAVSRIVLSLVGVVKGRLATAIGSGLTCNLRKEMVNKLQNLAIAYYDRHQVGSMISRVAHDSEVLNGLMQQLTGGFLLQIVQLFGVGGMLLWLNPKLAMYTLIPVPLVFLGTWFYWRAVYPRYYRLWDASSKQISVLSGMLSGIRIVKAFGQQKREYDSFATTADRLRDWRVWTEHASSRYAATMQLVFSLGGLIVWYVGGRDVIGRDMSLGELIAFLAYLSMFYAPLGAISNFTAWLTSFLSGSKRVFELLDTPITIQEPAQPESWTKQRGDIAFEDVSFGYDAHQPVLKNVSFQIRAGEMIGIVGRSGSGKSTMVNLLTRLYDVQQGRVTIDGIDVRDLAAADLRAHLGVVFQESSLFRGTVWSNLVYGRPETDIEEGLAAARGAGAHDFICRKPLAYETQLGERGSGLSGGEQQRLSIARTLLYDPQILVLDEATSNIDAEAERSIQKALEVLVRGRTTIAIAHRLSTLRNADRILVFDRGRLIEQGTHAQLLHQDGVYARLVRIQTQVSKDPSVDRLLNHNLDTSDTSQEKLNAPAQPERIDHKSAKQDDHQDGPPASSASDTAETARSESEHGTLVSQLPWLDPTEYRFVLDAFDQPRLQRRDEPDDGRIVNVVCAFPCIPARKIPERALLG